VAPFNNVLLSARNRNYLLRTNRSIIVVAELAKSFGNRRIRKSWRLPLRADRTVINRTVLTKEGDSFFDTIPDPDWEAGALANDVDTKNYMSCRTNVK